jgi:hypothetical protein
MEAANWWLGAIIVIADDVQLHNVRCCGRKPIGIRDLHTDTPL